MTPVPLAALSLRLRHHLAALWWLCLLYRRPAAFVRALEKATSRAARLRAGSILYLHALPPALILVIVGRLLLFGALGLAAERVLPTADLLAAISWHGEQIAVGIAVGIAGGIAILRAYYLPPHVAWIWPAPRPAAYPFHPVAWDDMCSVPFPGLCRLLAAYWEQDHGAGAREIDRLIDGYPSQQMEALKARAIVLARMAAREADLGRLEEMVERLSEGSRGFLQDVPKLRDLVADVAQRQRRLATVDVPAFRESLAAELVTAIETFKSKVAGLRYPLGEEFRRAADAWRAVARRQQEEARRVLETAPAAQVFRAGDPVDKEREAFVPRLALIAELQGQITLATGCPGLLLYGRRRVGKSTLIRNAEPFLPTSVRVARLSMQDPGAFGSLEGLLATIVGRACEAAGVPAGGEPEGLAAFYRRLGEVDAALAAADRRLVLAIDEYENIDAKIGEGVFPRDLLATFRELVQSHRRIVWLFAGSHAIEELAADWSSAFVSLRTVEVTPFSEAETRLLLTEPSGIRACGRRATRGGRGSRPRSGARAGSSASTPRRRAGRIWSQLVAETVVELVNLRGLKEASPGLLEEALVKAVVRGDVVLRQLVRNECGVEGEWAYLEGFREAEVQPVPTDEAVRRSLRRRLLVEEADGGWRMRVPLMRRWLIARG